MFDLAEFVNHCRDAVTDGGPSAVKEVLARTMARRSEVEVTLGVPTRASLSVLYAGPDLTILNAVWAPMMVFPPHDHRTWAVIGIYGGEEDNVFFRRTPTSLERAATRDVKVGEVVVFGDEVIHLVQNPREHSFTGGLHVYGGDYLNNPRSLWDADSMTEGAATFAESQLIFDRANEPLAYGRTAG